MVQLMKWLAGREEKRREEDKERENLMLRLVESISRQQTAVTEDLRSTEREREAREETRRREEYERMERFKADQAMLEQRLAIEREEREAWMKQMEANREEERHIRKEGFEKNMLFNMGQPKLQRLTESDDIEHYLTTFERVAHAYNWPQDMWVLNLAPLLTGKAQSAYASLNMERAKEYHLVKEAILKRYDINEEIYRQRFRGAKKKAEETYSGFGVRLNDMFNKWTGAEKEERTKEEICEMMVMEQLMESMPTDLKIWLKERKPKTILEVGELADDYVTARKCAKEEQKKMP